MLLCFSSMLKHEYVNIVFRYSYNRSASVSIHILLLVIVCVSSMSLLSRVQNVHSFVIKRILIAAPRYFSRSIEHLSSGKGLYISFFKFIILICSVLFTILDNFFVLLMEKQIIYA